MIVMAMNTRPYKEYLHFALFIILALLWSGSFINIRVVVSQFPPIFCALIRVILSLICLALLFLGMRKNIFMFSKQYWRLWMGGLFTQGLPFALLFFGEKFIAPALASIINSTVTIWSLLLGMLIFHDYTHTTPAKIMGIGLGFVGIIFIFFPFLHGSESSLIGMLAITGMAVSYAIGSLINQHIIFKHMKVSLELTIIHQHLASILFLLAVSLSLESWPQMAALWNMKTILAFLYLGVLATALAWMIYFHLIKEWGAVRAVSVMYLVPMLAILWDAIFLHIMPKQNELLGMATILSGVVLIQWVRKPIHSIENAE
jgi:drug/metabolite transporter (DMT)-like permease